MRAHIKVYRREVTVEINEDMTLVTLVLHPLSKFDTNRRYVINVTKHGEIDSSDMFNQMFDVMTLRVRKALAGKVNAMLQAKAQQMQTERETSATTEEETTMNEQIQVSAYRRPYTVTIEMDQDGNGTAKFQWRDGIYTEYSSAPIRNGKVDLSYCVTIAMKSRKVLQNRINEHLASTQEAPEEETTQSRVTLVVNDKVFEFIHNQGATQILVKPQGEKSFFIPSPYSATSEESLERIGLDYLKRELMTFDIITTQDNGDGVEVLRHDTDSRVVGQQFNLESFMKQMLKNRQVDDLTVRPIRNGLAGKKTVYGITYDISIVQVGRIAYAIRLQTQNKDIQEAHFIEEDLEDGVRVYHTFDMFGNYSGTAEINKEYQLVDYYHE